MRLPVRRGLIYLIGTVGLVISVSWAVWEVLYKLPESTAVETHQPVVVSEWIVAPAPAKEISTRRGDPLPAGPPAGVENSLLGQELRVVVASEEGSAALAQTNAASRAQVTPKHVASREQVAPNNAASREQVAPKNAASRTQATPNNAVSRAPVAPRVPRAHPQDVPTVAAMPGSTPASAAVPTGNVTGHPPTQPHVSHPAGDHMQPRQRWDADRDWSLPPPPANGPSLRVPPLAKDPNCPSCPPNKVPEMCRRAPKDLPVPSAAISRANSARRAAPAARPAKKMPPVTAKKAKGRPRGRQLLTPVLTRRATEMHVPVYRPLKEAALANMGAQIGRWFHGPGLHCGFWTRACAKQTVQEKGSSSPLRQGASGQGLSYTTLFPRGGPPQSLSPRDLVHFPDLHPGDFGSCALVALGRNLLGTQRGREIDAHDTVVRFTAPVRGFEEDVGHKADVVVVKRIEPGYDTVIGPSTRYLTFLLPDLLEKASTVREKATHTYLGKQILYMSDYGMDLVHKAYLSHSPSVKPHSGLFAAMALLSSSLCTRVDFYGFSAKGSGHFWDPVNQQRVLKAKHVPGIGRQILAQVMALGRGCVYD
eukprot:jgi/Mesvir1/24636/Mv21945-RA.1